MYLKNIYHKKAPLLILVSILCIAFTKYNFAQINITASDFPERGDTVRYSNSNGFLANFTATGPNFTWNFTSLSAQSQTLVNHADPDQADVFTQSLFGSTVLPTYRATYFLPARELPLATLASFVDVPIDEIYRFYRVTNQQVNIVGLSIAALGFAIGKRADTIEVAYQFPMNYGQSYESSGYVDLDLSAFAPFSLKQYRTRVSEVDGWGTITTPYGAFECLRIHHIISELDSILIDLGEGPEWYPIDIPTIHEYEWWTKNEKGPILKAKANEIFGVPVVNEIMYRDIFRPELNVGLQENIAVETLLYPNPVEDVLHLTHAETDQEYFILNMQGQIVTQSSSSSQINVAHLNSGTYFLVLLNNGKATMPKSFVKQ